MSIGLWSELDLFSLCIEADSRCGDKLDEIRMWSNLVAVIVGGCFSEFIVHLVKDFSFGCRVLIYLLGCHLFC